MGFYDFANSKTLSKLIKVEPGFGTSEVDEVNGEISIKVENNSIRVINKKTDMPVRIFSINGTMIHETFDDIIPNLSKGLYIVNIGSKTYKINL